MTDVVSCCRRKPWDLTVHASLFPSLQTPSLPTPVTIPVFPVAAIVCVVGAVFLLLVVMALILRKYPLVCQCVWVMDEGSTHLVVLLTMCEPRRMLGVGGGEGEEVSFSYSSLPSSLVEWRVLAVPWLTAVPTVERDVEMGAD